MGFPQQLRDFHLDVLEKLSLKYLLFTILMIILPTSPVGLDIERVSEDPYNEKQRIQVFCPKKLLDILTKSSYLRASGWEIIFHQFFSKTRMPELKMSYTTVDFHDPNNPENLINFPALGIIFFEGKTH